MMLLDYPYDEIEIDGQTFIGRWLAQYFDRAAGRRYSLGVRSNGKFFVLAKNEFNESITVEWFPNKESIDQANLPAELKEGAKLASNPAPKPTPRKSASTSTDKGKRLSWEQQLEALAIATRPRVAPPSAPCPCGHQQFWLAPSGDTFRCARCNPPPKPEEKYVERWWFVVP
jgi:hypothetical protein